MLLKLLNPINIIKLLTLLIKQNLDFIKNEFGLLLKVPNDKKTPIDTILELEIYNF